MIQKIFDELLIKINSQDYYKDKLISELKLYLIKLTQESNENIPDVINLINKNIIQLINSKDKNNLIVGILVIDQLLEVELDYSDENNMKVTRFANYLRILLKSDDLEVINKSAHTLGRLVKFNRSYNSELVEFEVKRCLEWLQDEKATDSNRFASIRILIELGSLTEVTALLHSFFPQIIDVILKIIINDSKTIIRENGAKCFEVYIKMIILRSSKIPENIARRSFLEIERGVRINSNESIHGSLLILNALLSFHPNTFGAVIDGKYDHICKFVVGKKENKDLMIRKVLISLLEKLATFNSSFFLLNIVEIINYLILQCNTQFRSEALLSLGKISSAVKSNILPFLSLILNEVKRSFINKRNVILNESETFLLIQMLLNSIEQNMIPILPNLLNQMFSSGIISQPLIETLEIVKTNFPIYKSKIQLQLINLISRILCEVPYFESYESSFDIAKYHKEKIDFQKVVVNESTIILAWKTLSSFDFTGFRLNFLVESALRYLEHEVVEVRKTASVTVASLISRNTAFHQTSSDTLKSVSNIVEKLVKRMNLDPEYRIRETIFLSLDKNVDSLLATPENIKFLFFAANDNFFEVRNLSIKTICRISKFNPSLVLPRLRKNLIKILYQLEFSTIPELKEDSSKILTSIVQNVQVEFLMRYVDPLSKSLIANVNSDQVGVASTAMECLGELFEVAASLMADKIDHLITVILHSLQSSKKLSALKLLGKIAGSAGITTGLYVKYPSLLNIFIDLLKNNQSSFVKKEVAICMGRIGAYDPSLVSLNSDSIAAATSDVVLLINLPKSDEFYAPTFCIRKLMEILVDSKLDQYHLLTIQTVMTIFKTLGSICSRFTGDVIPTFFLLMKSPAINSQMLNFYFQQLTQIILIVKIGMTPYIPELMTLVFKYWNSASNSRIIYLIDAISKFMIEELKEYFPTLIPKIFEKFESKNNYDKEEPNVELKLTVFEIIIRLSVHLDDYTNIIIPVILQVLNDDSESVIIQAESIKTLGKLFLIMELDDQLSTITLNLINILKKNANTQIQCEILESFYLIAVKSKFQFEVFIPLITDVLNLKNLSNYKLEELFFKIKQKFDIYEFDNIQTAYEGTLLNFEQLSIETSSKLSTNQTRLKKVWQVSNFNSDDDWYNWFRSFSNELLLQSPSQSLRACSNMANIYFPFAKELFNVAFLSCWNELNEANKKNLVSSLELTLNASSSLELLYAILNLAEFMEQDNKPLPISTNVFAAHSLKCHAYAKALYYKERDFLNHPDSANIDSLINIYNFLDLTDSSIGIIRYHEKAKTPGDLDNKSYYLPTSWYEKLNKWDDGLVAHERNLLDDESFNVYSTRNSMNFFSAFGEWSKVLQLSEDCWNKASLSERKILSPIAASAAWANEQFNLMEKYTETMSDSADSLFFNSILALKNNMSSADAMPFIDKARDYLVVELEALIGESYSRAYSVIVRLQMLAQLEEIISFGSASAEKQKVIATIWNDRLSGCQKSFDIWQKMLRIRSIVIKPKNDLTTHIKFSTLCRKSGKLNLASKSLLSLLNNQPANGDLKSLDTKSEDPRLVYAICKHLWESSTNGVEKINIIKLLKKFCGEFSSTIGIFKVNDINQQLSSLHASWKINLLSKIFTKLGDYSLYLQKDNFSKEAIPHITSLYGAATKCSSSYSSNNKFALANLEAINFFERNTAEANLNVFSSYVISALKGFSKSILLSHGRNSLQDTLRFLSLWFKYGHQPEINEVVVDLISLIPLATWLQVIPQLIARIDSTSIYVKGLIQKLLMTVGRYHPQALVYSLSVTSKSEKPVVRSAALTILNEMSNHSSTLIEQALVFGNEMIAVSMLWREIWCEGLLEALFCYRKRDIDEMIFRLDLLHKETDKQNPKTQNEIDFEMTYGNTLRKAHGLIRQYQVSHNKQNLERGVSLYEQVQRDLDKVLSKMTTLNLNEISPKLAMMKDLELSIPGTYSIHDEIVKIGSIHPVLTVMPSKQRPRRTEIIGSDGKTYQFLLKAHEDLRLDERVMQVFGLVNTLMKANPETLKRSLKITCYSVTPISTSSGLIGWVPNCDTLNNYICNYRDENKVRRDLEQLLIHSLAPKYDRLTLLQKVEIFEKVIELTSGEDLARSFWLKSKNSEVWLERRTNFTRSLALMSMVGYIIGLGDRHPLNLIVNKFSGSVVHIDFGDCFEVAMHRDKFPEKVPFRLTRMLVKAMEVGCLDGSFKITCESTMKVLREEKDSLMAVLEAFVYDPLINWRLMTGHSVDAGLSHTPSDESEKLSSTLSLDHHKSLGAGSIPLEDSEKKNFTDESLNQKALSVIDRIEKKLTGRDFKKGNAISVERQVELLIKEAISIENLCQSWHGWCPLWV